MRTEERPLNILCLASYEKGGDFLRECKREGCYVVFITAEKLTGGDWPREAIDEFHTLPDLRNRDDLIRLVSSIARRVVIDRIVPLDDYDVEKAAGLREHLRVPGMGETTARYFRDKLAMRVQAREKGIPVPEFVHALNYEQINDFLDRVPPPWLLKPRSEAAAMGIRRINSRDELWPVLDSLGDGQSYFLLEQYIPGEVFHVDAIAYERKILFAEAHRYTTPPLDVVHAGGLFITRTLVREAADTRALLDLHAKVIEALGFVRGVTHTEFIRGRDDGRYYFLETAARVGGAHIVDLVQATTGLNLWAEWAKIEIAGGTAPYTLPEHGEDYGGLIISLARQPEPDTSAYNDPEVVWRLKHHHHAGLIVKSPHPARVEELLEVYGPRFYHDFFASQPPLERAP